MEVEINITRRCKTCGNPLTNTEFGRCITCKNLWLIKRLKNSNAKVERLTKDNVELINKLKTKDKTVIAAANEDARTLSRMEKANSELRRNLSRAIEIAMELRDIVNHDHHHAMQISDTPSPECICGELYPCSTRHMLVRWGCELDAMKGVKEKENEENSG